MASIHLDLYLDHSMIHNFFTVTILYMTHLLRQIATWSANNESARKWHRGMV